MAEQSVLAVIPARYASSRFPGKPLANIQGKPMIQHVWDRAMAVEGIHKVVIATDDARIAEAVSGFGGEVQMTSPHHPSGTDRIWEVAQAEPAYGLVLNLQGDEPFVDTQALNRLIAAMSANSQAAIYTLVTPVRDPQEWHNPNAVKAVLTQNGRALYFSRASIPYHRDTANTDYGDRAYRHLGVYLYRREALEAFTQIAPSPLETLEKLEQLRALENDMPIFAMVTDYAPLGVDTPEDLEMLLRSLPQ
jgi:3-deoxy-manno-octulosonate cytidylyltransferase (CMP-KDO synthetase)